MRAVSGVLKTMCICVGEIMGAQAFDNLQGIASVTCLINMSVLVLGDPPVLGDP